jgi:hypothetical protein
MLACCDDLGSACSTSADCCGALQCSGGHCACAPAGHACLSGADCCSELSCDTATHTCTAPSKPDAGSSGGGSGSGSGSGAGGGSSGTGGSGSVRAAREPRPPRPRGGGAAPDSRASFSIRLAPEEQAHRRHLVARAEHEHVIAGL